MVADQRVKHQHALVNRPNENVGPGSDGSLLLPACTMQLTILTEHANLAKQVLMSTTNFHSGHQQFLGKPFLDAKFSTGLNISIGHEGLRTKGAGHSDENGQRSDRFESQAKPSVKPSGLLDIVKKTNESPKIRPDLETKAVKKRTPDTLPEEACARCGKMSRSLCPCNVSHQALSRLYRYCAGFNTPLASSVEVSELCEAPSHEKTFQML